MKRNLEHRAFPLVIPNDKPQFDLRVDFRAADDCGAMKLKSVPGLAPNFAASTQLPASRSFSMLGKLSVVYSVAVVSTFSRNFGFVGPRH
jgi:hypothetical protein